MAHCRCQCPQLYSTHTHPFGLESMGIGIHPSFRPVMNDHSAASSVFHVHMIQPD